MQALFELLLVTAFAAHLIAVNLAAAGPLYCVVVEWWGTRRGDVAAVQVARRFAIGSLLAFVFGIAIGAALLAILWHSDRSYWAALGRVPSYRWWFFGGELVFYFACMVPYVTLRPHVGESTHVAASAAADADSSLGETRPRGRWWHRLLAILAATNLLYHFPPLFTMLSLMSTRPELAGAPLDRSLYVTLFTDAETLARVAHHWLSALATTGVALMLLATRASATSAWATVFAARTSLAATVLQLPIGMWLVVVSPAGVQSQLLGGNLASTALFGTAVFFIVLLLQQLTAAALGDHSRATAIKSALFLLAVLLLMSAVLHRTRDVDRVNPLALAIRAEGL